MKKQMSKSEMRRHEAKETRTDERSESPSYQRRESRLGIEKHKSPKKGGY